MNHIVEYITYFFNKLIDSNALNPFNFFDAIFDKNIAGGVLFYQYILGFLLIYLFSFLLYKFVIKRLYMASFYTTRHRQIIRTNSFKIDIWWNVLAILKINSILIKVFSIIFLTEFFLSFNAIKQLSDNKLFVFFNGGEAGYLSAELVLVLKLVLLLLVQDLATYIAHRMSHRVPFLWCFHKVHHYPTHINYFANNRQHPFEGFLWGTISTVMITIFTVLFMPFYQDVGAIQFDNVLLMFVVVTFPKIMGIFVHIHVPLSFGSIFNKIFVSPAVHTLHHSDLIHDKNFGSKFSIWDVLFKTYYMPSSSSELLNHYQNLGAGGDDDYYKNIVDALIKPFKEAHGVLFKK